MAHFASIQSDNSEYIDNHLEILIPSTLQEVLVLDSNDTIYRLNWLKRTIIWKKSIKSMKYGHFQRYMLTVFPVCENAIDRLLREYYSRSDYSEHYDQLTRSINKVVDRYTSILLVGPDSHLYHSTRQKAISMFDNYTFETAVEAAPINIEGSDLAYLASESFSDLIIIDFDRGYGLAAPSSSVLTIVAKQQSLKRVDAHETVWKIDHATLTPASAVPLKVPQTRYGELVYRLAFVDSITVANDVVMVDKCNIINAVLINGSPTTEELGMQNPFALGFGRYWYDNHDSRLEELRDYYLTTCANNVVLDSVARLDASGSAMWMVQQNEADKYTLGSKMKVFRANESMQKLAVGSRGERWILDERGPLKHALTEPIGFLDISPSSENMKEIASSILSIQNSCFATAKSSAEDIARLMKSGTLIDMAGHVSTPMTELSVRSRTDIVEPPVSPYSFSTKLLLNEPDSTDIYKEGSFQQLGLHGFIIAAFLVLNAFLIKFLWRFTASSPASHANSLKPASNTDDSALRAGLIDEFAEAVNVRMLHTFQKLVENTGQCDDLVKEPRKPKSCSLVLELLNNGHFKRTFFKKKHVGAGGFGSVYKVNHRFEPGNSLYAVKVVKTVLDYKSNNVINAIVFREISSSRKVLSRYTVRYYTWWVEEDELPDRNKDSGSESECELHDNAEDRILNAGLKTNLYIQMEWCAGSTLRGWLNRKGGLTLDANGCLEPVFYVDNVSARLMGSEISEFVQFRENDSDIGSAAVSVPNLGPSSEVPFAFVLLFSQIVKGIAEIHRCKIIHRDVKPENIFFHEGVVKIGDFGLSKLLVDDESSIAGVKCGTPTYMPPDAKSTGAVDIYAAGIILLELLAPRFTTIHERHQALDGLKRRRTVPKTIGHGYWSELILRMTNTAPESRPTANEILCDLLDRYPNLRALL